MSHGIGIDILGYDRMEWLDGKWDEPFIVRVFTPAEREAALASSNPLIYFTLRFSAKEAVFKAMRMDSDSARLDEIEVLDDELGRPCCTLYGSMDERARSYGERYRFEVSLSYEANVAVAVAILEVE